MDLLKSGKRHGSFIWIANDKDVLKNNNDIHSTSTMQKKYNKMAYKKKESLITRSHYFIDR
jgi:hypothetical protein